MIAAVLAAAFAAVWPIEPVLVEEGVPGYATFQSNNQKLVQNGQGLFLAYLRTRNEAYTAQQWRLARSTDGGRTWTTVFQSMDATNPPVIETDATGNIYLVRPDFQTTDAYLYRFRADRGYRDPAVRRIPNGSAGKYCMAIDEPRGRLYYASHNGYLATLALDGGIIGSVQTHLAGPIAVQQYPYLVLDEAGVLHFAWTTNDNGRYLYRDIHYMRSADGGISWSRFDGTPLALPVVADDAGPADRISLDDEFEVSTWLSSMAVSGGSAHFVYLAQFPETPRQHYMRFALDSGEREIDTAPVFKGESLEVLALDGFFATGPGALYYTGSKYGQIVTLRSTDHGTTWQDHARCDAPFNVYALGGARRVTEDGYVVGCFTGFEAEAPSAVYFFRIPAAAAP